MAKKKSSGVNRAKAIRDYYKAHPNAKPLQVSAELKKQGIDVTAQYVSTIRSNSKRQQGEVGKPGRPSGKKADKDAPAKPTNHRKQKVSLPLLVRLKHLTREFGGIAETRAALDALEAIKD
ncbi:hypothetical protein RMSM_06034 [Rhodopirellula maiorica SM1]|uniref:Uncharacterized protein n=1 Tax=Rhodopirellula maiorica SM1 TaxID=1265738 RepID=M5RNT3_9BACT|nr:hypothetical protein [Rhodopirellula maiorica]EMI17047.1 hypothetical protein RMSM_06034 [Rhodopirellula maiorica SM1]